MVADGQIRYSGYFTKVPSTSIAGGIGAILLDRKLPLLDRLSPNAVVRYSGKCLFQTRRLRQLVQHYAGVRSVPSEMGSFELAYHRERKVRSANAKSMDTRQGWRSLESMAVDSDGLGCGCGMSVQPSLAIGAGAIDGR